MDCTELYDLLTTQAITVKTNPTPHLKVTKINIFHISRGFIELLISTNNTMITLIGANIFILYI